MSQRRELSPIKAVVAGFRLLGHPCCVGVASCVEATLRSIVEDGKGRLAILCQTVADCRQPVCLALVADLVQQLDPGR